MTGSCQSLPVTSRTAFSPVRLGLVRAEDPEIALRLVQPHHVAQHAAEHPGGLRHARAGHGDRQGIAAEVGQHQVAEQHAAVRVRAGAQPPVAGRHQAEQLLAGPALGVEQLTGPVGPEPLLELPQVRRVGPDFGQRHLVRPPGALHRQAVHLGRPGPALRGAQHDHRPARAVPVSPATFRYVSMVACLVLDGADPGDGRIHGRGHVLVHGGRLVAGDVARLVPVPAQQRIELVVADARQHRRIGDLPAVQVQDRQHGAVAGRVEEPVRVPAGGQRAGLGLPVADHAGHDQVRIVERRAVGVRQRVAELPALVDRAGGLRRDMARHPAGERELAEQHLHAGRVARHARVHLAVAALQPAVGQRGRAAVTRPDHVHHGLVTGGDRPVQVCPDEVQPGGGAPVTEQPGLDVLGPQRLGQQRVGHQVDLADRQVVGGPPVTIERAGLGRGQRPRCRRLFGGCRRLSHHAPPPRGTRHW